ncbi:RNA pseudouridine synthase [Xylophilus sp. GW821-FHT01B05]
MTEEPIRLAKHLAALRGCSRREAEQLIDGGWVLVDGVMVDVPESRVRPSQQVTVDPKAKPGPSLPVTLLLHKPAGYEAGAQPGKRGPALQLLQRANRAPKDRSQERALTRHFAHQVCVTPLETAASGLVVFTQDARIQRKLLEDAALVEHELIVEVKGEVPPEALAYLNRTPVIDGRAMLPAKVSISRDSPETTGLRFATKGHWPGQVAQMCEAAQLQLTAIKRIRVGRMALAGLEPGQWRYLMPYERF